MTCYARCSSCSRTFTEEAWGKLLLLGPTARKGTPPPESRRVERTHPIAPCATDGPRLARRDLTFAARLTRLQARDEARRRPPGAPGRPTSSAGSAFLCYGCHLTSSQILASTSRTDAANHLPPLAVGIPRSLRALAMARSEVAPLACSSAITGPRSAAHAAAASA
jgi:hypothetical protein